MPKPFLSREVPCVVLPSASARENDVGRKAYFNGGRNGDDADNEVTSLCDASGSEQNGQYIHRLRALKHVGATSRHIRRHRLQHIVTK